MIQDLSCATDKTKFYLFKNFSNKIAESYVEFREFFGHDFVNDLTGFMLHNLVDFVVYFVGGLLQLFE